MNGRPSVVAVAYYALKSMFCNCY